MLVLIVALVFSVGCSSVPTKDIQIDAQTDPKANMSGYNTYAWLATAAILNDPNGQWEPLQFDADSEVKFLIDGELRERGMSESSSDPDLAVVFAAGVDMDALGLKVGDETRIDMLKNVPQGALIVALVDVRTGFVAWVGVAAGEIQESPDTATVKARLAYAVSEMFKKLPK